METPPAYSELGQVQEQLTEKSRFKLNYLMNYQYPAELIKTALILARKIDVAWHYQFVPQRTKRICSDQLQHLCNKKQYWIAWSEIPFFRRQISERNSFHILFPILSETAVLFEIHSFTLKWSPEIPLSAIRNAIWNEDYEKKEDNCVYYNSCDSGQLTKL